MKNIYVFILCLPLILSCKQKKQSTPTYDNSWCAVEMEEQYIGTYLPKEFIETLHNTKSYVKSMNSKPNGNHIIAVKKNIVYGDDDYYDQYACRIQKGKMELRKLVENSLMTSKESEGGAKFFVLEN